MELYKAISSGTTALVRLGAPPSREVIAAILDPVRGIGADMFLSVGESVRAFTSEAEIAPPSAALRIAAAYERTRDASVTHWTLPTEGGNVEVSFTDREYTITHGPWKVQSSHGVDGSGEDVLVEFAGIAGARPGLIVESGGRRTAVCAVGSPAELSQISLLSPPRTDPQVDLVSAIAIVGQREVDLTDGAGAVVGTQRIGALQVRGYDPSVGEMFSADTLAIASAAAAWAWLADDGVREWIVVFGGGNTRVVLGGEVTVSAQAEIFAAITWSSPTDL